MTEQKRGNPLPRFALLDAHSAPFVSRIFTANCRQSYKYGTHGDRTAIVVMRPVMRRRLQQLVPKPSDSA